MAQPQPSTRGELSKTPLAHLLVFCLEKRLTGTLELVAPDGRGNALLLHEGYVTKAKTADPVAYLGRVLLELGLADEASVNATLLEVAKSKQLHGRLLLARGVLNQASLAKGLDCQVRRKLAHLFSLPPQTTFTFGAHDGLAAWGGDALARVDPFPVVWRATCELPPWELVHAVLSRVQHNPLRVAPQGNIARLGLDADALALIERLRAQPMRPADLAALGITSPRIAQLLTYVLLVTKLVEIGEAVVPSPPPAGIRPSRPPARSSPSFRPHQSSVPDFGGATGTRPVAPTSGPTTEVMPTRTVLPAAAAGQKRAATPSPGSVQLIPKAAAVPTFGNPPDLGARQAEIQTRAATIDKQNYFEMLGIAQTASTDEVKAAFLGLARKWHPDRLPKELDAKRDDCARVFSRLGEAHGVLSDPEQRQKYMRLLTEGGATPEDQDEIATVLEAAQTFQKAEVFLKRNDLAQAETHGRRAHEADPKQADYLALVAWVESQKPEFQSPKATQDRIAMLDKAVHLNANCEKAYFYRAMLHKRLGNDKLAARDFRRAVELNPRNIDATREVRLYGMRKQRDTSVPPPKSASAPTVAPGSPRTKSGLLDKLFKR